MTPAYWVQFQERSYQIEPGDDSDEQFSYQGSWGVDVDILALHNSEIKGGDVERLWETDDLYGYDKLNKGDTAYLVLASYRDGDTFGSGEYWCIPAIKSDETEAHIAARKCYGENNKKDTGTDYRPWDGYFASLQTTEVIRLRVGESPARRTVVRP